MKAKILGERKKGRLGELMRKAEDDPVIKAALENRQQSKPEVEKKEEYNLASVLEMSFEQPLWKVAFSEGSVLGCAKYAGIDFIKIDNYLDKQINLIAGFSDAATSIARFPSRDRISFAIGDKDGNITVFRYKNGKYKRRCIKNVLNNSVDALAFSPNGYLMAGSEQKEHKLYEVRSGLFGGTSIKRVEGGVHEKGFYDVSFSAFGKYLAELVGLNFSIAEYMPKPEFSGYWVKYSPYPKISGRQFEQQLTSISLSPDAKYLAAGTLPDHCLRIYKIVRGKPEEVASERLYEKVNCVDWSPDKRHIAVACEDHNVYIYDFKENEN